MAKPVILYDSRFDGGVHSASSTAPGYDVHNIHDWRPFTFWRPQTMPAWVQVDSANLAWEFANSVDGFTGNNLTLTPQPTLVQLLSTASDPRLFSPANLQIDGSVNRYLVARIRRDSGGPTWQGQVYYENVQHTYSNDFTKTIVDPTAGQTGVWATAVWDMWDLDLAGGDDWKTGSLVEQIRFDFGTGNAEQFSIDYIAVLPEISTDYGLIWGHDLASNGITCDFQYSGDGSTWGSAAIVTPQSDKPFFAEWSLSVPRRWWRINLTEGFVTGQLPTIAIVAIGNKLELPRGFDLGFDPNARTPRGRFSTSVNGNPLGRTITHEEWQAALGVELVTWDWLRDTFEPAWLDHLRDEPYVLAWDRARYPNELNLVESLGGDRGPQRPGDWGYLAWEVKGLAR